MNRNSPVPEHDVQVHSRIAKTTTRSGGFAWRSASRRRFASESSGETQWVR